MCVYVYVYIYYIFFFIFFFIDLGFIGSNFQMSENISLEWQWWQLSASFIESTNLLISRI